MFDARYKIILYEVLGWICICWEIVYMTIWHAWFQQFTDKAHTKLNVLLAEMLGNSNGLLQLDLFSVGWYKRGQVGLHCVEH